MCPCVLSAVYLTKGAQNSFRKTPRVFLCISKSQIPNPNLESVFYGLHVKLHVYLHQHGSDTPSWLWRSCWEIFSLSHRVRQQISVEWMNGQFVNNHPAYVLDHKNDDVFSCKLIVWERWWQKPHTLVS